VTYELNSTQNGKVFRNPLVFSKTFSPQRRRGRREKIFFLKSGDTDFRKQFTASGGKNRVAMSGFPLAASPANGKKWFLCVLCVSAVN
jgi:hypothetical protein